MFHQNTCYHYCLVILDPLCQNLISIEDILSQLQRFLTNEWEANMLTTCRRNGEGYLWDPGDSYEHPLSFTCSLVTVKACVTTLPEDGMITKIPAYQE